jgi:probable blue pigment (indigoidine) exporter
VTVFGTLLPYALYFAALARISVTHVSITSTLEPVVAGLVAFAVLGETLAPPQLAGGALFLAGTASCTSAGDCPAVRWLAGQARDAR